MRKESTREDERRKQEYQHTIGIDRVNPPAESGTIPPDQQLTTRTTSIADTLPRDDEVSFVSGVFWPPANQTEQRQ